MEVHPTWIIIIGLGLDIVAVLIILNPVIEYFNSRIEGFGRSLVRIIQSLGSEISKSFEGKKTEEEIRKQWEESIEYRISDVETEIKDIHSKDIKTKKRIIIGTSILILGFLLQIIGNYYQNPL